MISYIRQTLIRMLFIASLVLVAAPGAFSQPPPEDPGQGENPVGNAPIGGGLLILVALGAVYGVRKYYASEKGK